MEQRRNYTEEFKKETVELSFNSEKTCSKDIADELGISCHNLTRWRREYKNLAFPGQGKQKLTPEQEKIKALEAELKETQIERDILKKAVAIFSKQPK